MLRRSSLITIVGLAVTVLTLQSARAQDPSCQLSVEGSGDSTVFINASNCAGDTIAVIAGAEGNQKQFPVANGPDISSPFRVTQCDLDLNTGKSTGLTYTAVVVSGPDKGKTSATYSGTLDPDPPQEADQPPGVALSGSFSPGSWVGPGDVITVSVGASDDIGVTEVKVVDPDGKVVLDNHLTPKLPPGSKCHLHKVTDMVNFDVPRSYTVPTNPPVPVIRFNALARDTGDHAVTTTTEYHTEATWTGMMLLDGTSIVPNNRCNAHWRIGLSVKTTLKTEVTGSAVARHDRLQCAYVGPRDSGADLTFAITGTFDGKLFRLYFNLTGGGGPAWGIGGLHLLMLPTPLPVELTIHLGNRDYASGSVATENAGNVEGKNATATLAGSLQLQCCFSETAAPPPAKIPPLFLGEDKEPVPLGGDR